MGHSNCTTNYDRLLLQSASGITKCDIYYKVRSSSGKILYYDWQFELSCTTTHLHIGSKTFRGFNMWKFHFYFVKHSHCLLCISTLLELRASGVLLTVLKIKLGIARSSLFFMGLWVFKSLPLEIRQCDTLFSFCNKVKYFSWWSIIDLSNSSVPFWI